MTKVRVLPNGCWEWTGTTNRDGYPLFYFERRYVYAHRWAYEQLIEPIATRLHLDHTCHSSDPTCTRGDSCPHRRCVCPAHLEPVTQQENNRRIRHPGMPRGTQLTPKTVCPRGHPLEGDNVFVGKDGRRRCRTCMRTRNRRAKTSMKGKAREQRYTSSERRQRYLQNYREQQRDENRDYAKRHWQENRATLQAQRAARKAAETPEQREARLARQRAYTAKYRAKLRTSA